MGQKVHPYGFRLGYTKPWKSRWFVEKDYDKLLLEDYKLKTELKEKLKSASVSSVEVERPGNKLRIIIKTARPGIIIGRKGAEIDKLKQDLQKRTSREVHVDIQEVHKPELDAQLVSESIALQLEKRVGFRRAMRKQDVAGAGELPSSLLAGGVVQDDDEVASAGRIQAALDRAPRRQQVAQADTGEIVSQGSAEQGSRRRGRGNTRDNLDLDRGGIADRL